MAEGIRGHASDGKTGCLRYRTVNFDRLTIKTLAGQLEEIGYANDEQFLGAYTFEHRVDEVFQDLSEIGYTRRLLHEGKYCSESGALYWYYDPEMISSDEAFTHTSRRVNDTSNRGNKR